MSFDPPIIDGNRVAQLATAEGTNMGGLMGLPRIYDFTGLLVQVGILKAKPA